VGTPGVVHDNWIMKKKLNPKNWRVFVYDEADVMLDVQNLGDQTMRVAKHIPPTCQILLFSATFSDNVRDFAHKMVPNAIELTLKREELAVEAISQFFIPCNNLEHKFQVLLDIYTLLTVGSAIIFCKVRRAFAPLIPSLPATQPPFFFSFFLDQTKRRQNFRGNEEGWLPRLSALRRSQII